MLTKYLTYYKWGVQLLSLFGLLFVCTFIVLGLSYIISPHIAGIGFQEMASFTNYNDSNFLKTMKFTQVLYTFGGFLLPALLFAYFAYPSAKNYLNTQLPKNKLHFALGILAIISSAFFINMVNDWNQLIPFGKDIVDAENKASDLTKAILNIHGLPNLLFTLFYIALLPAIAEEFLFRGCLQNLIITALNNKNVWIAIVITGTVFGVMHGQMLSVFPRIILGIALGYIYYYSGSIWVSVAAHFLNNGLQVLMTYLFLNGYTKIDIDKTPSPGFALGILSGIISIGFIYVMYTKKAAYNMHSLLHEDAINSEIENIGI